MKEKKVPLRKCIICQEMKDKRELIRITANKEGHVHVDPTGKAHGRGAYLCRQTACFEKLKKTKALNRAFHREIPDEVYESIEESIGKEKNHE
jgi:uncharacterized protein